MRGDETMKGRYMKYIVVAAAMAAAMSVASCGNDRTAAEPDQLGKDDGSGEGDGQYGR